MFDRYFKLKVGLHLVTGHQVRFRSRYYCSYCTEEWNSKDVTR